MIRDAILLEIFATTTLLENIEGLLLQGRFGIILRRPHLAEAVILTTTDEDNHPLLTGTVIHHLHHLRSEDAIRQILRTVVMVGRPPCPLHLRPMIDTNEGRMNDMLLIPLRTQEGLEPLLLQGYVKIMIEAHPQPGRVFDLIFILCSTLFLPE
jgi:hypothetical protein